MKKAHKFLLAGLLVAGVLMLNACGHTPPSPCNSYGFLGSSCGPEFPVNR